MLSIALLSSLLLVFGEAALAIEPKRHEGRRLSMSHPPPSPPPSNGTHSFNFTLPLNSTLSNSTLPFNYTLSNYTLSHNASSFNFSAPLFNNTSGLNLTHSLHNSTLALSVNSTRLNTSITTSTVANASSVVLPNATSTATAAVATHTVQVGPGGRATFSPSNISANVGDSVLFLFNPTNFTVTQSTFDTPCEHYTYNYGLRNGFDSGYMSVTNGSMTQKSYLIHVVDESPIWGFCRQAELCQAGMVFAVNAPRTGSDTFDAFLSNARSSPSSSPSDNHMTYTFMAGVAAAIFIGICAVWLCLVRRRNLRRRGRYQALSAETLAFADADVDADLDYSKRKSVSVPRQMGEIWDQGPRSYRDRLE